jgi:hypothetical protein
MNDYMELKRLAGMKDRIIKEMKMKLEMRDNNLSEATAGYLKDVQHMRELLFRKDQLKSGDLDLFEV